MSNCDNCLHYDACKTHYSLGALALIDGDCSNYADKSEYIHLPYRLGGVVWYIKDNDSNLIKSAEVLGVGVSKGDFEHLFLRDKNGKVFIKEADKVCPTYEEAEKALKESNNNA